MRATSRFLRYAAVGVLLLFAVLGALFAAGYAYADLAPVLAVALTVGWLALAGGLGWLAWRRPDTAVPVLLGLTVAVAVLSVTDARMDLLDRDATGPVTTVLILAVLVPLAVLALHRATAAGLFLLVLGVYQVLASGLLHAVAGDEAPWRALLAGSSGVVVVPVLLAAVLLLLSGWLAHEPPGSLAPPAHVRTAH
jgi:hypothetical protein